MEYLGVEYFLNSSNRVYWLYLISAGVIAFAFIYINPKYSNAFSKDIWLHKSAKNDYKYFLVVSFLKTTLILPLVAYLLSYKNVSLIVAIFLQDNFGYFEKDANSKEFIVIFYTITLFIVGDFTRYWLHRFLHIIPSLWRLHEVHHSAEVLTPLTFYRVHPLENILFGFRYALTTGAVTGVFIYFYGASIGIVEIAGANIFVFFSGLLGSNLRHSHIPLRYGIFEKIFISPYMHQLHHSKEQTHKNFGGVLSIWDYIFNSVHIEKTNINIEFGLKNNKVHNSIIEMLFKPFKRKKFEKNSI